MSALESHQRPCSMAIVTFADDLHALVIQDRLRSMPETSCGVIEADRLADHPDALSWYAPVDEPSFTVSGRDGELLDVASLDAILFRRWNHPQRDIPPLADPAQVEVVHRSCSTTLLGGLLTSFHGAWVSTPKQRAAPRTNSFSFERHRPLVSRYRRRSSAKIHRPSAPSVQRFQVQR